MVQFVSRVASFMNIHSLGTMVYREKHDEPEGERCQRWKSLRTGCTAWQLHRRDFRAYLMRWVIIIGTDRAPYRSVLIGRALSLGDLYNRPAAIDARHNLSLSPGENLIGADATYTPNWFPAITPRSLALWLRNQLRDLPRFPQVLRSTSVSQQQVTSSVRRMFDGDIVATESTCLSSESILIAM